MPYKPIGTVPLKGVINGVKSVRVVGSNTPLNYKVYNKYLTGYSSELAYTIVPDGNNHKVYNKSLTGYSSELAYTIIFHK